MLFSGIKYLILNIGLIFSKAFFHSQSRISQVLKDKLYAGFYLGSLSPDFKPVFGVVASHGAPSFDASLAEGRGNSLSALGYSLQYKLDEIPNCIKSIIDSNISVLVKYLGEGFLYESAVMFRNYNIPTEMATYDVISNIWHQDSHDGERLLKIFVLPHKVTELDGPLVFIDDLATRKYWFQLADRWDFNKIRAVPHFNEQQFFLGDKGSYLIINTAKCMHRASIPSHFRDMLQITLFPRWQPSNDRKLYKK